MGGLSTERDSAVCYLPAKRRSRSFAPLITPQTMTCLWEPRLPHGRFAPTGPLAAPLRMTLALDAIIVDRGD
jgi:hypothetical protein